MFKSIRTLLGVCEGEVKELKDNIGVLEAKVKDILNKRKLEKKYLEAEIGVQKKEVLRLKEELLKEANKVTYINSDENDFLKKRTTYLENKIEKLIAEKDELNKFNTKYAVELAELKGIKELKELEKSLQDLSEKRSEYLNDINEFNMLYNIKLGDIIRKILKLEEEQLQNAIDEKQKQYDEDEEAYRDTKATLAELKENIDKLKDVLDQIDEDDEDYDEIYSAYEELKEEYSRLKDELNSQEEELKEAREALEDDPLFGEYEEAKRDYEEYENEYNETKEVQDSTYAINEKQKQELKKLFRKASRLCHPDLVEDKNKDMAHTLMQKLNEAYSQKDIKSVKKILISLENKTIFILPSDKITDQDVLTAKIDEIKESIVELKEELEEIQQSKTFEIIQSIENMDEYFEEMLRKLEARYNNLTTDTFEYDNNTIRSDECERLNYFSTTALAKRHNIEAKPHLFDKLLELDLIYKNNNGKYSLTDEGINIGGKYTQNEIGGRWVVWEKYALDEIIKDLKESLGFVSAYENKLTPHQLVVYNDIIEDVNNIFTDNSEDNKMSLSGSAGVGKTFLTIKVIEELQSANIDLVVTAPTHKALSVITDSLKKYGIKNVKTKTLHSFLSLKMKIDVDSGEKFFEVQNNNQDRDYTSVLIVDESSMIGDDLFGFINDNIYNSKIGLVLFIGDPYQLPPVNSKENSIFDLPQSYFLEQIIRQKEDSYIIKIATKIRDCIKNKDFSHKIESFFSNNIEGLVVYSERDEFLKAYYSNHEEPWHDKNQIIADYTNNSVDFYNKISREKYWEDRGNLEPEQLEVGDVVVFQDSYIEEKEVKHQNGSVVQIEKCSKEYDDELGFEYWLCTDSYGDEFRVIDNASNPTYMKLLEDKRKDAEDTEDVYHRRNKWIEYYALKEKYATIKFNYASTIHKLQGSTYETVFIDIRKMSNLYSYRPIEEYEFLYRLLYVAVTRASKNIVVLK